MGHLIRRCVSAAAVLLALSAVAHADGSVEPRAYLPITLKASLPSPARCVGVKPEFLPGISVYTNVYSETVLAAELCNPMPLAAKSLRYAIDALDANGNIIETVFVDANALIASGMTICTQDILSVYPKEVESWQFRVVSWSNAPNIFSRIVALNAEVDRNTMTITGRIRNDGLDIFGPLVVNVAIRDHLGALLSCNSRAKTNTDVLQPGQVTSFSAQFPMYGSVTQELYARYTSNSLAVTTR